jgi:hypothetical protein
MKKAVCVLFAVFVVLCSFGVPKAQAAGIGFYGAGGGGTVDWYQHDERFRKTARHQTYGFVLDTAPASNRLFNYQLNIAYDKFSNNNASAWKDTDLDGFMMSHNFGFGGLITPNIRLWFGPEVRLSWHEGSPNSFPNYTIRTFGIGIGPVVGMNFNVGERLTFALKGGYQFINYYGYGQGQFSHTTNDASSSNHYYYDPREKLFYLALEIMLRTSKDK